MMRASARGIGLDPLHPVLWFCRFLAVVRPERADDMSMNDDSLVFRLVYGSFSMLFTADAGFPAEEYMLNNDAELKTTVLKVGHHGSRYSTSEDFLRRVNPRLALISAGKGNRFGLPSSDTLALLHRKGIQVFRTDMDGTIELVSDGTSWSISNPYPRD